jgi:hypothetical protein
MNAKGCTFIIYFTYSVLINNNQFRHVLEVYCCKKTHDDLQCAEVKKCVKSRDARVGIRIDQVVVTFRGTNVTAWQS